MQIKTINLIINTNYPYAIKSHEKEKLFLLLVFIVSISNKIECQSNIVM